MQASWQAGLAEIDSVFSVSAPPTAMLFHIFHSLTADTADEVLESS